jgi:hypothetical protein
MQPTDEKTRKEELERRKHRASTSTNQQINERRAGQRS